METYSFWREARGALPRTRASSRRFPPSRRPVPSSIRRPLLTEFSERTRAAIGNPSALPESVGEHARITARAGRILLDGEQADRWTVAGGPADERLPGFAAERLQSRGDDGRRRG